MLLVVWLTLIKLLSYWRAISNVKISPIPSGERADIIRHLASSLLASEAEIMEANDRDLRAAKARGVTGPLFDR